MNKRTSLWRDFLRKVLIAVGLVIGANGLVMAFWSPPWFLYWQVPVSCTILICLMGILLFDTLFREGQR